MNARRRLESYILPQFSLSTQGMVKALIEDFRKEILKDVYKKLQQEGGTQISYDDWAPCNCPELVQLMGMFDV